jgi:hypothetical protein
VTDLFDDEAPQDQRGNQQEQDHAVEQVNRQRCHATARFDLRHHDRDRQHEQPVLNQQNWQHIGIRLQQRR